MNTEKLTKGNRIADDIESCKTHIERVAYTQVGNVVPRKTYLVIPGNTGEIEIPASLFRVIGKLILSEHQQKLIELEKEFDAL